jgi:hypothetical protein
MKRSLFIVTAFLGLVAACKSELPINLEQTPPQPAVENQLSEAQIRGRDGMHMVHVPAGQF